jgi:hypothetical protein
MLQKSTAYHDSILPIEILNIIFRMKYEMESIKPNRNVIYNYFVRSFVSMMNVRQSHGNPQIAIRKIMKHEELYNFFHHKRCIPTIQFSPLLFQILQLYSNFIDRPSICTIYTRLREHLKTKENIRNFLKNDIECIMKAIQRIWRQLNYYLLNAEVYQGYYISIRLDPERWRYKHHQLTPLFPQYPMYEFHENLRFNEFYQMDRLMLTRHVLDNLVIGIKISLESVDVDNNEEPANSGKSE